MHLLSRQRRPAEDCLGKHTALLDTIGLLGRDGFLSIVEDCNQHTLVELPEESNELVWVPKHPHFLPDGISADHVKDFCQVNEGCID